LPCHDGAVAIEGTVVEIQRQSAKCTRVVVDIGTQADMPERISIDMSSCVVWAGRTGDTLRGFVRRDPSDLRRFDAVPYCTR
jgi:hypothetical protein